MWSTARLIADGDLVITRENIQPLLIASGNELQSKFGYYRHSDLIGLPYGSKVGSRNGKGFIHILRPTPELWTMALPHRTQILYLADISFITSYLNIKRTSCVIEAGTGSGSFTHSLARTVGTAGHVWSYEFHEQRADKAREEFSSHGMADIVTLTQRNVIKDGFTIENEADAVFLDLPAPWDAVKHAKTALRKDKPARICCFSPCMEQVLRTVSSLNDAGFQDITMYETLSRPTDIHQIPTPLSTSIIADRLRKSEIRREEKRIRQIAQTKARFATQHKRKRGLEEGNPSTSLATSSSHVDETNSTGGNGKRQKKEDTEIDIMDVEQPPVLLPSRLDIIANEKPSDSTEEMEMSAPQLPKNVSKIFTEVRGHTSYLTFACLLPDFVVGTDSQSTHGNNSTIDYIEHDIVEGSKNT